LGIGVSFKAISSSNNQFVPPMAGRIDYNMGDLEA